MPWSPCLAVSGTNGQEGKKEGRASRNAGSVFSLCVSLISCLLSLSFLSLSFQTSDTPCSFLFRSLSVFSLFSVLHHSLSLSFFLRQKALLLVSYFLRLFSVLNPRFLPTSHPFFSSPRVCFLYDVSFLTCSSSDPFSFHPLAAPSLSDGL